MSTVQAVIFILTSYYFTTTPITLLVKIKRKEELNPLLNSLHHQKYESFYHTY
jgi:hypothetical protein